MKNQGFINQKPQFKASGNAFVIILIIIALLGALTATVTRMGDTQDNVSQEEAQVIASKVLRQAQTVASAVESLRSRGCSINGLSFENNVVTTGYTNAQSPADKSCWLFDMAGAGLTFPLPPSKSNDGSNWNFSGNYSVYGVGAERETGVACTDKCRDLIMILPLVDLNVCKAINKVSGIATSAAETPPQLSSGYAVKLNSKFAASSTSADTPNFSDPNYVGIPIYSGSTPLNVQKLWDKKTACFELASNGYMQENGTTVSGAGKYFFYQVLVER